ncbi:MAG: DUF1573 domain-containing protein [Prevotella sp.]|nr:DUF1573 domain-containing protein [Prevotella sp.]
MKKLLFTTLMLIAGINMVFAQAKIQFDKSEYNFGSFPETSPVQKCTFTFTNSGDKPLVINQAIASCGCTVPSYPKAPIKPGQKGTIEVTYNGKTKFTGHFKKAITIYTNGVPETTRIYIEGTMTEVNPDKK